MPKEPKPRSISTNRPSPFPSSPAAAPPPVLQQYDEIRCPVCMEHPHNAVLLLCSSHANGCRPFLCDTSHRHSNCLDQFRKSTLPCPLCRGALSGSKIIHAARTHMNAKTRNCSAEKCPFYGDYKDLRKHARSAHPMERPAAADPARERDWRRLERQRDWGDLVSTMGVGEEEGLGLGFGFSTVSFLLVLRFTGSGRRGLVRRDWRRRVGRVLWGESVFDAEIGRRDEDDDDDDDGGDDVDDGAGGEDL